MNELIKDHNRIIENLDFSGNENSFFDFWHLHYDSEGIGNVSFNERMEFIKEGIRLYHLLSEKLRNYPHKFQLWIIIDEEESGEDAVYIHSHIPNNDYFPFIIENKYTQITKNTILLDFLIDLDFKIIKENNEDTNFYFLYKEGIGVDLLIGE